MLRGIIVDDAPWPVEPLNEKSAPEEVPPAEKPKPAEPKDSGKAADAGGTSDAEEEVETKEFKVVQRGRKKKVVDKSKAQPARPVSSAGPPA